ncbi:MAG: hypothetical protein COB02_17630 [Candidatus Cloacimonadota bacterium]|nr:MAG: hypothetical protein COB02_17630 [Candidatus Cloacimonadota bacterium]
MGIVFESYLGLIFFCWLPIFIAIYFFKKNPKNEIVSSHFLWQKVIDSKLQASWREKFKKNALFWLQLLIFILLFLSLSEPKLKTIFKSSHKVAIIIDNSGSMSSKIAYSSRLYQAKELAQYYKTKFNAQVDLYTWNKSLQKSNESGDFDFNLASIEGTHLPNGSSGKLIKLILEKKKEVDTFYFISDFIAPNLRKFFKNNNYSFSIVGGKENNSYIKNITILDKSQSHKTLEIKYYSNHSSPVRFKVQSQNLSISSINNNSQKGKNIYKMVVEKPNIWISVLLDENDNLEADNLKIRYLRKKKMKISIFNLDKFSLWSIFFKGFFSNDERFELGKKRSKNMNINLEKKLPSNFLKNTIYLLTGSSENKNKGKNFSLSKTSDVIAYLSANDFQKYHSKIETLPGNDLLVNILKNGEKVTLLTELTNSSYVLNLRESIENISNSNTSILFENLIQKFLKIRNEKLYYEVGDDLDGFIPEKANKADKLGIYEKESIKRYYNYPLKESMLKGQNAENYIMSFNKSSKFTSKKGQSDLYLIGVLLTIFILLLEWLTFVKRI